MQQDLDRELTRLIRRSPVVDRKLKENWLRVLPHLADTEKARLSSTLRRADDDLRAGGQAGER